MHDSPNHDPPPPLPAGEAASDRQLDRRQLLKRGAVASAAALWVEPVIEVIGIGPRDAAVASTAPRRPTAGQGRGPRQPRERTPRPDRDSRRQRGSSGRTDEDG